MAQRIDEITRQARHGSMAALIQLMNERLADAGIRTRAMFAEGVLQILCEAATLDQLERTQLVPRLKAILEELAPRNFRRIRINARIAREQQLLWLEEINRDPENQLLWSEEIQLATPNWLQQMGRYFQEQQSAANQKQKPDKSLLEKRSRPNTYWQGVIGGVTLSLLILAGAWGWSRWRSQPEATQLIRAEKSVSVSPTPANRSLPVPNSDPFAEAIRLAEQSSLKGQTAKTAAEWLDLAAKWQRASELMNAVPKSDRRYATARERATLYRQNSEMAQKQARRFQ